MSTRTAFRAARGTTWWKTKRSLRLISDGSRSKERSWIVTTAGHGERERQRVLEVPERRTQLPEQAGKGHRQPQLLERRPETHGLDSLGDEAGVTRDGGDPNSGGGRQ